MRFERNEGGGNVEGYLFGLWGGGKQKRMFEEKTKRRIIRLIFFEG